MAPTNEQTGCFGLNSGTVKDLKVLVAASTNTVAENDCFHFGFQS